MSRYAVLGSPIAHSKSPTIHTLFAEQTKQELQYEAIKVEADEFDSFVLDFFASGGQGLNITVPHKERAYALATNLEPRAKLAGAVNTLFLNSGQEICGDNTDGPGLVRDIQVNLGLSIKGKNLLVVGAGGAVRGALVSLIEAEPAAITLVNRTISNAQRLQHTFEKEFDISVAEFDSLEGSFDIIINGTSLSLSNEIPALTPSHLSNNSCCYDMMYKNEDTSFVTWAKQNGATLAVDGVGMLVEQAAESFLRWRGVRPETSSIISQLSQSSQLSKQ
jgi:shikimate dehydrogenase